MMTSLPPYAFACYYVIGMLRQCASQQGGRDTFSSNDTSMPSWNGPMLLSTSGHGAYKLFPVDVEFSKNHPATQDEDVKRLTANDQLQFKTMTVGKRLLLLPQRLYSFTN